MKDGEGGLVPGVGEVEVGTQAFVLEDVWKAADAEGIMARRGLNGGNSDGKINGGGESVESVVVGGGARSG